MAAPALVESDAALGADAAEVVCKDPLLKPTAVLWLYDEDAQEWRFVIATDDVGRRGPHAAYLRVRNALKKSQLLDRLPLRRIVVVDPSDALLQTVGKAMGTPKNELAGLSVYDCVFNGMLVPGMHIYRLNDACATSRESLASAHADQSTSDGS